jgi:hypothetical protein
MGFTGQKIYPLGYPNGIVEHMKTIDRALQRVHPHQWETSS